MAISRTVWIDDAYRYPIKVQHTVSIDGETRHRQTVAYGDLHIDGGLENTGDRPLEYVSAATPAFPAAEVDEFYEH
ncbi:MAG: hypothetical protein ACOC3I_09985 [Verrucomicrobiota bacterium]